MTDVSLSSILGQPHAPVGGLLALAGAPGPNPTINGAEYLKTSVLKTVAGYENLLTDAPELCVNVGALGMAPAQSVDGGIVAVNGYVYGGPGTATAALYYTTDVVNTAWTASAVTSGQLMDAFTMGSRGILLHSAGNIHSFLAATRTNIVFAGVQCGGANNAGTLATASTSLGVSNGNIKTSVDGAAWTNRNPGGGSGTPIMCEWLEAGGKFVYVSNNGHYYTTANGYTLTDGGAIAGATSAALMTSGTFRANSHARTATSALMLVVLGATQYLLRFTDGISVSATPVATALQLDGHAQTGSGWTLSAINGTYIISSGAISGSYSSVYYTSSDDGLTWQRGAIPVHPTSGTATLAVLAQGPGGTAIGVYSTTSVALHSTPLSSATHVGIIRPLAVTAALAPGTATTASTPPYYVRIK